jgi:hypothetical protein
MSLKLKEQTKNPPIHNVVMEDDHGVTPKLVLLASNILKEKCNVLNSFFSFLRNYEKRKTHNMLMLDHRHKNLCLLVSFFIAYEQGKTIVEEHDKRSLLPMLLKCHHVLHPLLELKSLTNHPNDQDTSLDIFR